MNIVLTGFMATGKSEVGKDLARLLEMEFIDTDDLIEEKVEMKISEIFAKKGEKFFRDLESEIAKEVGGWDNYVIATGGGIVLRQENINSLKKNGKIRKGSNAKSAYYYKKCFNWKFLFFSFHV